ncbi:LADA_0G05204g1_1 [Lachancea dasiensis]|uniref:rRNA biogenesis protein RRP5 n=1 Tax=Lachancea dasiensis TaxID=1072105 RepID=A0A1G4JSJ8_9SACH|nr:LADA_0G05204g1_1 [Lachancea dasiensis]
MRCDELPTYKTNSSFEALGFGLVTREFFEVRFEGKFKMSLSGGQKRKRTDESPLTRQDATSQPSTSSLLQNTEEVSFPRGGASALSPLELKQVANEAASDVLFKTDAAPRSTASKDSQRPKKKKKLGSSAGDVSKTSAESGAEDSVAIVEHLTFRNLPVGTLVLGQISQVNKHDLCVSFSDGLHGFVTLPNICEPFTQILESLDDSMESDEEVDASGSDEEYDSDGDSAKNPVQTEIKSKDLPDLSHYFTEGQWLRCAVQSNTAFDNTNKKSKRIELTIEPQATNKLIEEDLVRSCTVQCAVKSIEDHGAILDVGIDGVHGFISKKDHSLLPELQVGSVFLGNVWKKSGRALTVNLDFKNKKSKVTQISSVDVVIPGQSVDFLCQKKTSNGVIGKVFGLVDGFLNIAQQPDFQSGKTSEGAYSVGSSVRARIIATLVNKTGDKFVIMSELPHIMSLTGEPLQKQALEAFPVGYTFDHCDLKGRDSQFFYLKLGNGSIGQVHISNTGTEEPSSGCPTRVLGYNNFDGYFQLSTDPKTISVEYLRTSDIPLGTILSSCEIKEVSEKGIVLSILGGQFRAVVPPLHISDIRLVYPERKFKIGSKVKGMVIKVNNRGHLFLTLKKSLVGLDRDEVQLASSFNEIDIIASKGSKVAASVEIFKNNGCVISFLGGLRGFLPNSEISEAFVKRPQDHLRLGQTVIVKVLQHSEENNRVIVTCKVSSESASQQKEAIENMALGKSIIKVAVVEKTKDSLVVEQVATGLRGVIYVGHLSDSRIEQNRAQLKKIKIGHEFDGLVIDKDGRTRVFNLSCKKSLMKDAEKSLLPTTYDEVKERGHQAPMHGYVKSVSEKGIFVAFNGQFVGLVLPSYAADSRDINLETKYYINQSVTAYLLRSDDKNERFLLSFKEPKPNALKPSKEATIAINPIDQSIKTLEDFTVGKFTKAMVKAVKRNQLNVVVADNLHGAIDVSEVFDNFEDIEDKKNPLASFQKGDVLDVKVIGYHDVKTHKFLPISHRSSKNILLGLTAKPSNLKGSAQVDIKKLKSGDEIVGFVNNIMKDIVWLTVSPTIKAKVAFFDLSDETSEFDNGVESSFPIGSALKVRVTNVDYDRNTLTVSGRSHTIQDFKDISLGDKLPARILNVTDSYVLLELGEGIRGVAFITDALNDYSQSLKDAYGSQKNEIISVTVIALNEGKINLSLRSSESIDGNAKSHTQLRRGDVLRAFVKKVTDKGVFLHLSSTLQAFVPVSKLTDSYIKDWKKFYKPLQSVVGKVVNCDDDSHILLTLKESEVNGDLNILKNYSDIKVGEIYEGTVRNVTDFGVFIKLDNTLNITGLAHKTQVADIRVDDLSSIFGVGDKVKAFVLKVTPEKKQLSLGLKASYFKDPETADSHSEASATNEEVDEDDDDGEELVEGEFIEKDGVSSESDEDDQVSTVLDEQQLPSVDGLSLSAGFDWTTSILDQAQEDESSEEEDNFTENKKSKHRKKSSMQTVEDQTIDINTRAPESVGDFERMIMGNPNSSVIWMNFMAFQLQLGEVDRAREVAERALKTINFREESEKLNIWIGLLNLENTFGTEVTLDEAFSRACQYMDSYVIHTKLINIYQMGNNYQKAADLFKATAKKFGSDKVGIWVSWSEFLIGQGQSEEARQVLANALRALPRRSHIEVVRKFAQLEFTKGDREQGRSLFEGLLADTPKRIDLWNVYVDQEIKAGDKKKVEDLFERILSRKLTRKQAKFFFGKWLEFEEARDDQKNAEYVKAKASEYVARLNQKAVSAE